MAGTSPTPSSDLYPSRTRARLETRARVRGAALAEFHRVGVEAAQIEDIVRAAGVARGTFYLHFPTKDHVLIDLLAERSARVAESLEGLDPREPGVALRKVVDGMHGELVGEHAALMRDALATIARHPDEVERQAPALGEGLTRLLAAGQAEGCVRRDAPAADLAAVLLASVAGLLVTRREASPRALKTALRRAATLLEPIVVPSAGD